MFFGLQPWNYIIGTNNGATWFGGSIGGMNDMGGGDHIGGAKRIDAATGDHNCPGASGITVTDGTPVGVGRGWDIG